jgi:hypothetical protein
MTIDLCKYKDIFGAPNTGAHSYRVFNIAIVDVIGTFLLAYIIQMIFGIKSYFNVLIFCFLLGIFSHRLFCVKTTIDKLLP